VIRPHIHVPYDKVEENLTFIKARKLDLEIYFSADALDRLTPADIEKLMKKLDYGPSLSVHGPFMDLSPGAVDTKVREVTLLRFSQTLDLADILRPRAIIFHSGYEKWKYALNMDIWLEKSHSVWQIVLEKAARISTKIAIENIFEDTPDNLSALARRVSSPLFGLCFDTGHFNLFSTVSLENWLSETSNHILAYHLHDNDSSGDAHLAIGRGTFDFDLFFRIMGKRHDIVHTVEAHSADDALQSMEVLKNY